MLKQEHILMSVAVGALALSGAQPSVFAVVGLPLSMFVFGLFLAAQILEQKLALLDEPCRVAVSARSVRSARQASPYDSSQTTAYPGPAIAQSS